MGGPTRARSPVPAIREGVEEQLGLFDAVLEATAYPLVVFDVRDGGRLVVACANQAAVWSGRLTTVDWRGRHASDVMPKDALDALLDGYTEALRLGGTYSYEEFVVITGRETWWMTTLAPIIDADGRPGRLVATHLPAEFVRRTEDALRRSEANFTRLNESSLDPSFVVRPDGRVAYANPAAAKLLEQSRAADLVGRQLDELMSPDAREGLSGLISSALAGGGSAPIEQRFVSAGGRPVTVEATPIRIEYEGAPSVLLLARDVTELRAMQAQLAFADRMAALGRMAAGVAHEVNNPLAYAHANVHYAITELGRLAEHRTVPESDVDLAEVVASLREALDGVGRVRSIVRDLKGLSYFEETSAGPSSVVSALEAAIKVAQREIRFRARLVTEIQEVPLVTGSESRLVQVFLNLLVNAAQAIVDGSADENEICVRARSEHGAVLVEVSDTGVGIADDQRAKLFDPFYTTKPAGSGMGLGLSICQQIVRAAGGSIEVESSLGKGSTFRVRLPAAEPGSMRAPAEARAPATRRARILLVDDEPAVGRSIARLLGRLHDVKLETKASDAIATLRGDPSFDVILCDLMMPQMDGTQFFAEVGRFAPNLLGQIVFLSGGVSTPGVRSFLDALPNECLEKPLDVPVLLALIEKTSEKTRPPEGV